MPPVFDEAFESFGKTIAPETAIPEWDYDLSPEKVDGLLARLQRYKQFGHEAPTVAPEP